jgi:hypothetical protein
VTYPQNHRAKTKHLTVLKLLKNPLSMSPNFFKPDQLELAIDDLVFLREAKADEKCCELVKCGSAAAGDESGGEGGLLQRRGMFPKERTPDHLELIEFPLQEAAKMGDWEFLRECLENKVFLHLLILS